MGLETGRPVKEPIKKGWIAIAQQRWSRCAGSINTWEKACSMGEHVENARRPAEQFGLRVTDGIKRCLG